MSKVPSTNSWESTAQRVIIHTADYLGFDGQGTFGGRQRFIRDVATLIRDTWGRDVIIIQKGRKNFETTCSNGLKVIGLKTNLTARGDPWLALKVTKFLRKGDAVLYASGEDAWPFFARDSKAIQHGVWWDGPQSWSTRRIQRLRAFACLRKIRSMLCVDTNFINWIRTFGREGLSLTSKCTYVPNYADLDRISISNERGSEKLRLICARRYEKKRGIDLFVDALSLLKERGFDFFAHISAPGGDKALSDKVTSKRFFPGQVSTSADNFDEVLLRYGNSHVAVVPTLWSEGTSLAAVEAICAGVPVLTTAVGGLPNVVVPGFNGLIVQPHASAIADAIIALDDHTVLRQMRSNCLSMRQALSFSTWKERVLAWLKE